MAAAIVIVRAVIVIALMIVSMSVAMRRPGRKRISQIPPRLRAASHFLIGQQTTIQLTLKRVSTSAARHHGKRLPAVSERFLPFLSSALGHFAIPSLRVARRPPMTCGRALDLRSRKVETADFIHPGSEPEEAFRAKQPC